MMMICPDTDEALSNATLAAINALDRTLMA